MKTESNGYRWIKKEGTNTKHIDTRTSHAWTKTQNTHNEAKGKEKHESKDGKYRFRD